MIENKIKALYPDARIEPQGKGVKMIFFGNNDEVIIVNGERIMFAEGHNDERSFKTEREVLKYIHKRKQEELSC